MSGKVRFVKGCNLCPKRIKSWIAAMATEKKQGVDAVVTKLDGSTAKVFLFIDNGRILFREERGNPKNFRHKEFKSVEI